LKTSRKSLLVIVSLLCIAGSSLAGYGTFWVTSNIVHVDVQYAVALSYSVRRNRVSLTAAVTNNGSPVGAGINVEFYYSLNSGEWTYFTTQPTNHRGVARATYRITVDGEYDFKATVSFL
jgi:hypothetical protein